LGCPPPLQFLQLLFGAIEFLFERAVLSSDGFFFRSISHDLSVVLDIVSVPFN
jgi:hypothetical protein